MISPGRRPALAEGLPSQTFITKIPSCRSISKPYRLAISLSTRLAPIYGRTTRPFLASSSKIGLAELMGIANPIPSTPETAIFAELIPTTSPSALTSAPPELPGLIAASVWIRSNLRSPNWMERFKALITPAVTLPRNSSPSGLPIAIAGSPTCKVEESPKSATGRLFSSIFTTARSVAASAPNTLPLTLRPSVRLTMISEAPSTTWLLVAIRPDLS